MIKRFPRLTPWLAGLLTTALMFGAMALYSDFTFALSDDIPILQAFIGFAGGVPADYCYSIHTLLGWLLCGLSNLLPGFGWFSAVQLFLIALSSTVIVKSLIQCFARRRWPAWLGWLAGALYLAVFAMRYACHITFTMTSALCMSAAVAQMMSVRLRDNRRAARDFLGGALLLAAGQLIRPENLPTGLAFWLLAAVCRWLCEYPRGERKAAKPLLIGAVIGVALAGGLFAEEKIELRARGLDEHVAWQEARSRVMDYTDFYYHTPPETLEALGWSEAQFKMLANWYFYDDAFNAETLQTLYDAQPDIREKMDVPTRLTAAAASIDDGFALDSALPDMLWALAALAAACLLAALFGRRLWSALAALAGAGLCAAMVGYLGWTGRVMPRSVLCAFLPTGAFLLALLPTALGERGDTRAWRLAPAALAACVSAALMVSATVALLPGIARVYDPDKEGVDNYADLDALALENTDSLLVADMSLTGDARLFPDLSNGVPGNIVSISGWEARMPCQLYAFAKYGVDASSPALFVADNVLLASTDPAPSDTLLAYISEATGADIEWDYYQTYGYVNLFTIYEY